MINFEDPLVTARRLAREEANLTRRTRLLAAAELDSWVKTAGKILRKSHPARAAKTRAEAIAWLDDLWGLPDPVLVDQARRAIQS
jgi:hypothetical protein